MIQHAVLLPHDWLIGPTSVQIKRNNSSGNFTRTLNVLVGLRVISMNKPIIILRLNFIALNKKCPRILDKTPTSDGSSALHGLLHLFLIVPAQICEAGDVRRRLHGRTGPEAREVMPVRHFTVEHGRLWKREVNIKVVMMNN